MDHIRLAFSAVFLTAFLRLFSKNSISESALHLTLIVYVMSKFNGFYLLDQNMLPIIFELVKVALIMTILIGDLIDGAVVSNKASPKSLSPH